MQKSVRVEQTGDWNVRCDGCLKWMHKYVVNTTMRCPNCGYPTIGIMSPESRRPHHVERRLLRTTARNIGDGSLPISGKVVIGLIDHIAELQDRLSSYSTVVEDNGLSVYVDSRLPGDAPSEGC